MNERMMRHDAPETALVDREYSLFSQDLEKYENELREAIYGRRLLVIGGAGSIGSQTLHAMLNYEPAAVHVIDHNENGLAELVRDLRSGDESFNLDDLITLPFDYSSASFRGWLGTRSEPYDAILNFSALKHVRSEKDPYSILAMLDTNVYKLMGLIDRAARLSYETRLFCVSTDKAANPSSMMGASKRLMEHALFLGSGAHDCFTKVTSARFANVALSNGSLLQSWQYRLARHQPLACPRECRRYFVSLRESGHLCMLASCLGEHRNLMIPSLEPEKHLVRLEDVVEKFLSHYGYDTYFVEDEREAKDRLKELSASGKWPVLLTPLDTIGEKPYEEFIAENETAYPTHMESLHRIPYTRPVTDGSFVALCDWMANILDENGIDEQRLTIAMMREKIGSVEGGFLKSHRQSKNLLDQRM